MVVDVEDLGGRKCLRHLAHAFAARVEDDEQIDRLLLAVCGRLRFFDDVTGTEKSEIARNIIVDDDAHTLAEVAQIVHDAEGGADGISVGIDMRRDDDVLRRLEQRACLLQ